MYEQSIAVNLGTNSIQTGLCGEDAPARELFTYTCDDEIKNVDYVVQPNQSVQYAMEEGQVINMDLMQRLLSTSLNGIGDVTRSDTVVVVSCRPESSVPFYSQLSELLFEHVGVFATFMQSQLIFDLYASGRNTGVIVNCGAGGTTVQVSGEGFLFDHYYHSPLKGSRHMTRLLMDELKKRSAFSFLDTTNDTHVEIADAWRVKLLQNQKSLTLPDGEIIHLDDNNDSDKFLLQFSDRLFCDEDFIQQLVPCTQQQCASIPALIKKTIDAQEINIRRHLWGNVLLTGKNSLPLNLTSNVKSAVEPFADHTRVLAPPDRSYMSWIGESILGSLSTFVSAPQFTKYAYQEMGSYCARNLRSLY